MSRGSPATGAGRVRRRTAAQDPRPSSSFGPRPTRLAPEASTVAGHAEVPPGRHRHRRRPAVGPRWRARAGGDRVHVADGLPGERCLQRAREPDRRPLLTRRTRLRRAEGRPHPRLRLADGHDAHAVRRPAPAGAQLLGSRHAREWRWIRTSRPRPTSTCSTHTTRSSAASRPRGATACPTPPGPTIDGAVVSGRQSRLTAAGEVMTGSRAGAHQRLVPAVPQPLDRKPRVRPGRGALRHGRRRRELQLRRLRPDQEPVRGPAGPAGTRSRRRTPREARCAARTCAAPAT